MLKKNKIMENVMKFIHLHERHHLVLTDQKTKQEIGIPIILDKKTVFFSE